MKRVHPLPTILTLGNFGSGFVAIVLAARSLVPAKEAATLPITGHQTDLIYIACGCLFLAMLFDLLDGKVARMTGSACRFGAEMDSLADVVSFGAAPAMILCIHWIRVEPDTAHWWSLVLVCGFIYAACAAIRLGRYNVESTETKATDYFRGIPSPGAGGAVVTMFLFVHDGRIRPILEGALGPQWMMRLLAAHMVIIGLLMVSRIPYAHVSNRLLGGRKRLTHLVAGLLGLIVILLYPVYLLALAFNGYIAWGLITEARRILRRRRNRDTASHADDEEGEGTGETL
jgi:CDP-diacylglycerol---serine O-phosphatidyltransferase